jgi:hypothetical protein
MRNAGSVVTLQANWKKGRKVAVGLSTETRSGKELGLYDMSGNV